mgnify:CR=1 FL=1
MDVKNSRRKECGDDDDDDDEWNLFFFYSILGIKNRLFVYLFVADMIIDALK